MALTVENLILGNKYNWINQPERLIYIGIRQPILQGPNRWYQFAKVDESKVWCECLESDLRNMERSNKL